MTKITFEKDECMKKYSPSERKEILKAFEKLQKMIVTEERYGIPFEKIFNNASVKHDVFGNGFYTFKAHGRDKAQIRILYKFIRKTMEDFERSRETTFVHEKVAIVDSECLFCLEMHMVSIKRRNDNAYMEDFQRYVDCYI